jgi:hypothetical protein
LTVSNGAHLLSRPAKQIQQLELQTSRISTLKKDKVTSFLDPLEAISTVNPFWWICKQRKKLLRAEVWSKKLVLANLRSEVQYADFQEM